MIDKNKDLNKIILYKNTNYNISICKHYLKTKQSMAAVTIDHRLNIGMSSQEQLILLNLNCTQMKSLCLFVYFKTKMATTAEQSLAYDHI